MASFHINNEGNPGLCRAAHGRCPYGSAENHFASEEAARKNYETQQAVQQLQSVRKAKPIIEPRLALKLPEGEREESQIMFLSSAELVPGARVRFYHNAVQREGIFVGVNEDKTVSLKIDGEVETVRDMPQWMTLVRREASETAQARMRIERENAMENNVQNLTPNSPIRDLAKNAAAKADTWGAFYGRFFTGRLPGWEAEGKYMKDPTATFSKYLRTFKHEVEKNQKQNIPFPYETALNTVAADFENNGAFYGDSKPVRNRAKKLLQNVVEGVDADHEMSEESRRVLAEMFGEDYSLPAKATKTEGENTNYSFEP